MLGSMSKDIIALLVWSNGTESGVSNLVLSRTECSSDFLIAIVGCRSGRAVNAGSPEKGKRFRFIHVEVQVYFSRDGLCFLSHALV